MNLTAALPSWTKKAFAVLAAGAILLGTMALSAQAETTRTDEKPELKFTTINSGAFPDWTINSSLTAKGDGQYELKSNTWGIWTEADHGDYAYKEYNFNYGNKATLTEEVTIDSWLAKHANGSVGIMIRSSLRPNASTIFFHVRQEYIMIIYRMEDGKTCVRGMETSNPRNFPLSLRLELKGTNVVCSYRLASGGWTKVGSAPFTHDGKIFAGVGAHSALQEDTATANFSNMVVTIDSPDGFNDSGETDDKPPIVDDDEVPADSPLTDEQKKFVLLRETFSDGSIFDGEESAINPIWKSSNESPEIVTTADKTNRYLYSQSENADYVVGNQNWTDYSVTMDLTFTSDSLPEEQNNFMVLVRHTDIAQYGYHDYAVYFHGRNKISLGSREYARKQSDTPKIYQTVDYNYAQDVYERDKDGHIVFDENGNPAILEKNLDVKHQLRVDAMDNIITVYWDGEQILQYTDLGDEVNNDGQLLGSNVKAYGCIGFVNTTAAVAIDNITVLKLNDTLGGDYDNNIGGNWNQPIPDYVQTYIDNKWYLK